MKTMLCLLMAAVALSIAPRSHAASAGSLDTRFYPGTGPNTIISAAICQPDGKVIVAGLFTNFNGVAHPGVVRLNENGSVDTSFNHGSGVNVAATVALVRTAAVQNAGKILVGGGFSSYDDAPAAGQVLHQWIQAAHPH